MRFAGHVEGRAKRFCTDLDSEYEYHSILNNKHPQRGYREREREREKDKNVQCFSVKSKPIQATVNCFSLQALATVLSLAPPPSASLFLSHTRSSTFFSDVG